MAFPIAVLFLIAGASSAVAQLAPPAPAPAYEIPPTLKASETLEPALLRSPLHHVSEEVSTYGYANGYILNSKLGAMHVRSTAMLRVRVGEIRALAEIEKLKGTAEFKDALAIAAKSPLVAAKNLITHPVDTLSGVPRGAGRLLQRAGEGLRGKNKPSEYEDRRIQSMIGFSKAKRDLAFKLRVDPYSSNKRLQEELNSLAWAGYAGKMTVSAVLVAGGGTAITAAAGLKSVEEFAILIRDSNPIDLQIANRRKLVAMGVREPIAEALLNNPWYSPSSETALVLLLERMGAVAGKEGFVRQATTAGSESEAMVYLQTARLITRYHEGVAKVSALSDYHGIPICYDTAGTLVVPLYWDHGAWTERAESAVEGLGSFPEPGKPAKAYHIYSSGQMTPRVRQELAARKIKLTEGVFEGGLRGGG